MPAGGSSVVASIKVGLIEAGIEKHIVYPPQGFVILCIINCK
jgi:hypothetical protein